MYGTIDHVHGGKKHRYSKRLTSKHRTSKRRTSKHRTNSKTHNKRSWLSRLFGV